MEANINIGAVAPKQFKFKVPSPLDPAPAADSVVTDPSNAVVESLPIPEVENTVEADGAKSSELPPSETAIASNKLFGAMWRSDRIHQLGTLDRQTKKFRNFHVKDIAEAVRRALALSGSGAEAYFACAEYLTPNSRIATNAYGAWAFWFDIDCCEDKAKSGKGYATEDGARNALRQFCTDTGLPNPTLIVSSGGGLHVYWVLDKIVERLTWQACAGKFKALTHALNFLADDSRTADIASVLRVPGTLNFKYNPPRPVTLLQASEQFIPQATFFAAIDSAHGKLCPTAVTKAACPTSSNGNGGSSERYPPDLERLASALAILPPDCDEHTWKFKRIAAIARAAFQYPELRDALYKLLRSWSSGELCGKPSKAWVTPGSSNGLTGEQAFDSVWKRFFNADDAGKRTSLGTIYFEAKEAGWVYTRTGCSNDAEEFERCETTRVEDQAPQLPVVATSANFASDDPIASADGTVDVAPAIWVLNGQFAFIEENSSIYRLEFGNFISPADFKIQHNNQTIWIADDTGKSKPFVLGTAWLNSPKRRQHKSLVIRPSEGSVTKDNCLNEWKGFSITPAHGNVKPFLRLLVRLAPNRAARRYIQKWMAHLIQRPDVKMFVSLALWSHAQGVGKNLLFEALVEVIGAIHATVIGQEELTGAFNGWANRRVFVIGDEVSGSDKRQQNDKIKGLITGTTLSINEKFQPQRDVPNLLNFVFLSNHHDAMFVSDGDRRFFVWEVEAGPLPQSQIDEFVEWRDNGGLAHLHHFLLHYPLGDFNPRAPAPMTSAKQQMADDNRSDLEAWLADMMASDVTQIFGRELATATEIGKKYESETEHKAPSSKAIVGACKRLGAYARPDQVRVEGNKKLRPLALARVGFWKAKSEAEWAVEMAREVLINL